MTMSNGNSSQAFPLPPLLRSTKRKAREHQGAWAKHVGLPVVETNSIGMPLVVIPPGEFDMGSTPRKSLSVL